MYNETSLYLELEVVMDLLKSVLVSIVVLGLLFFGIYLAGRKELLEKAESNLAKAQDLYEYKNDPEGALNLLELQPEKELQEKYYFLKFRILFSQGKLYEAESISNKLLKMNPNNAYYNYLISLVYYNSGDYDKAIKLLEKSVKLEPKNCDYKIYLSRLYYNSGKADKSITLLEKAMVEDPNNETIYQEIFGIYNQEKQYKKALDVCLKAYKKFNYDYAKTYLLADLYEKTGDKKSAIKYFKEVKDKDPYDNTNASLRIFNLTKKKYTPPKAKQNSKKNLVDFNEDGNSIIAKIKINGKEGQFKIDPENPNTIVYKKFADKNKSITSNTFGVIEFKEGKNAIKDAMPVCYINIGFSNKTINNGRAFIVKNEKDKIDGVIGSNILDNLNYEIDYQNKKIIMNN